MKAFLTVLLSLGVPKWAIALALASLVSFLGPKVVAQIEKDKARRVVKSARLESEDKRLAADLKALELAGEDVHALVLVTEEAIENGRKELALQAIGRLRRLGVPEASLARFDDLLNGPLPSMAVEAAMRVERLLERSQLEQAETLATRALRRWPQDRELADLAARCQALRSGAAELATPAPDANSTPA